MTEDEILDEIKKYSFYHIIELTENIKTPGAPFTAIQEMPLNLLRSLNLEGKRVLDIGCRDGLFSFEAEKRGAKEVIGIDNDLSPAATEFLIPYFNSKVRMHEANLFNLTPDSFGRFDLIMFLGVLYHLRYPFWALKIIKDLLNDDGLLLIESGMLMDDNQHALLFCPTGDESPYEPTSCTFFNVKGLSDTLTSLGFTIMDVQILKKNPPPGKTEKLIDIIFGRKTKMTAGRATFICRKTPEVDTKESADITQYWDSTHSVHTDMYLEEKKKEIWWQQPDGERPSSENLEKPHDL